MIASVSRTLTWLVLAFACAGLVPAAVDAQESPDSTASLGLPGQLGDFTFGQPQGETATYDADFQLKPDSREGVLHVTATIDPAWHTYSVTQPDGGPLKTEIKVKSPEIEVLGPFVAAPPPETKFYKEFWGDLPNEEHHGTVTWTAPIRLKEGVSPESFELKVAIDGQACTNGLGQCIPIGGEPIAKFAGYNQELAVARGPVEAPSPTPNSQAATGRAQTDSQSSGAAASATTGSSKSAGTAAPAAASIGAGMLAAYIGLGLLGGLVLNLMPCVLPVIGLKVLSLAEQAHMHRAEVLKLNLWFTAGIISVFMVLATLASAFTLSWGEQFTDTAFKITMTAVVFAMALSFLGVWEIPIPGFVGRGVSNDLQQKEGALGAFFKGVFTTILSTPCSGPALGAVFAVIVGQPAYIAYILFFSIGLGMALPYLVIGLFPSLLRFLPKPGQWMETFKHLMGFVLLVTVAYLFTTLNPIYFVPTWTLLIGVWFACWLVGRIPVTAEGGRKLRSWITAGAAVAATALLITSSTFQALVQPPLVAATGTVAAKDQGPHQLIKWQPYSPEALDEALASGKTVMLEFTAQWCLTCKVNLVRAIHTEEVAKVVDQNEVVALLADWTDKNDQIKEALGKLNANSIPLLAIYPAGKKDDVILLRDLISKSQLVSALQKAGPSQSAETTAMIANPESTIANN